MSAKGTIPFVRTNAKVSPFGDLYYWLILLSWPAFAGIFVLCFSVVNLVFGGLYLFVGGLANVAPGFWDHVFFSVHTIATVGYGNVYPVSMAANWVVTVETMIGVFMVALTTGLVFSKFSRPSAKVVFSREAVVHLRNGVPCLVFRMANARRHHVAEASLNVALLKDDVTLEGDRIRKLHTLVLERSQTPLFVLSWVVFHPITPESPLFGLTSEEILSGNMRIMLSLTGYDAFLGQTIHARHMYLPEQIKFGFRFIDALKTISAHELHLDFDLFHEIERVGD